MWMQKCILTELFNLIVFEKTLQTGQNEVLFFFLYRHFSKSIICTLSLPFIVSCADWWGKKKKIP